MIRSALANATLAPAVGDPADDLVAVVDERRRGETASRRRAPLVAASPAGGNASFRTRADCKRRVDQPRALGGPADRAASRPPAVDPMLRRERDGGAKSAIEGRAGRGRRVAATDPAPRARDPRPPARALRAPGERPARRSDRRARPDDPLPEHERPQPRRRLRAAARRAAELGAGARCATRTGRGGDPARRPCADEGAADPGGPAPPAHRRRRHPRSAGSRAPGATRRSTSCSDCPAWAARPPPA